MKTTRRCWLYSWHATKICEAVGVWPCVTCVTMTSCLLMALDALAAGQPWTALPRARTGKAALYARYTAIWRNAAETGLPSDAWRSAWGPEKCSGQGERTNDATLLALTLNDDESNKNGIERPRRRFWRWTDGQRMSDWVRRTRHSQSMLQAVWSEHAAGRW